MHPSPLLLMELFPRGNTMTLEEALGSYLDHLERERHLGRRTIYSYGQELGLLLRVLAARQVVEVVQVTRGQLIDFLNRSGPKGPLSPSTRNKKLIVMRGFFRYLKARGVVDDAPTNGIPWARVPRHEAPTLRPRDVDRLLAQIEGARWRSVRDRALIFCLFHTGLRLAELLSLRRAQIDLRRRQLLGVRRKGGHEQPLPLTRVASENLEAWLNAREALPVQEGMVFVSRTGDGLNHRTVQTRLRNLGRAAGFPFPVTPHMLRHAFATELLRTGANLEEARRLLGHASIVTTSRYLHPDQASLRRAVNRLDRRRKRDTNEDN